ncbi:MAG: hypothetical protein J6L69_03335 [Lachnospiraceae bacterium]|nr:hypothetical protein [Lachnospiraceae bacterium]
MKSLGTVFKQIYGNGLKEYGFIKVKSKEPYYARLVGDEIVHIITFREEFTPRQYYKSFVVLFGVATVYRKEIDLDEKVKYNSECLNEISCLIENNDCFRFYYEENNETDMSNKVEETFVLTKNYILPFLNKITSLEACVDYYFKYKPSLLRIFADARYVQKWIGGKCNEGLLCPLVYGKEGIDKYVDAKRMEFEKYDKVELDLINNNKSGLSMEEHTNKKTERQESMNEQIRTFELFVNDEEWEKMIQNELKDRKEHNEQNLIKYGIILK